MSFLNKIKGWSQKDDAEADALHADHATFGEVTAADEALAPHG